MKAWRRNVSLLMLVSLTATTAYADWRGAFIGGGLGGMIGGGWGAVAGAAIGSFFGNGNQESAPTVVYNTIEAAAPPVQLSGGAPINYGAVENAVRGGMRDGVVEGMRIVYREQKIQEVRTLMSSNDMRFAALKKALRQKRLLAEQASSEGNAICSAYCGFLDEKGQLQARALSIRGADAAHAYAELGNQCGDQLVFRDLRYVRRKVEKENLLYQTLVPASAPYACTAIDAAQSTGATEKSLSPESTQSRAAAAPDARVAR